MKQASTTKKIVAAGGMALGLGFASLLGSAGIAGAAPENCDHPCTGSYPEGSSWPGVSYVDDDGFQNLETSSGYNVAASNPNPNRELGLDPR
jgi:hypothetical protein